MSTYFLLDPFEFPYYFYRIRVELISVLSIRKFERIQKKIWRHKMSIMLNEISINEEMLPKYTYARSGYDITSIYKQSLTGLNSEFSFS